MIADVGHDMGLVRHEFLQSFHLGHQIFRSLGVCGSCGGGRSSQPATVAARMQESRESGRVAS